VGSSPKLKIFSWGLLCVLRRREVGAEMANDGIRCSSLLSRDKAHLARDEAGGREDF
jgi:hypothetical protein